MASSNSSAGIRWSRQETRTLLSILGEAEYIQRLQTMHHNADVYQAVSKRMQQEGFRRTERQCRSKFKVLKALYLKAYVAHATSVGDPPHCPFYDTLDQLLRNQVVTDPDNLMEDAAWAKHYDQTSVAPDTPGEEGTSILRAKRTQAAADHQPALKTVEEPDEDCRLRVSDQMRETSDLEDSWDESSGAGCSQGTPSYSSSHHLFRGAVAPCQSSPMTRLGVSGEPSPCTSRNTPGVASTQQPPPMSSSGVPYVFGGVRPLTNEPPPRWARRRRRSVARTIAAELAENRRLARELSKREEEKLDRLIAIGEEASAQQDTANELRRDAVIAVRRLATAVEEATGAFQLGLEKLLQRLISNTKS
ncbi:zinc finger and SCAN domain containing 29 isoform X1 [Saccopteryx leptura]|uniref:zinc finger and SCAN domain containing 29 isoform X1 n=1 Tax=Saccopteryx leptura TaxID=249018 RepID=UPI00339C37CD